MKSILFALLAFVAISAVAQTPYLERKITVSLKSESIQQALQKISQAGGFVFSYNPDIVDRERVVTYNFVDRSVREILDEIFKGSVQYKARGKYVILTASPQTSARKEPAIVSGYVVDESTGERLRDVSIYDPVTLSSAVTDSYGYFEIKIDRPPSEIILSVNREHYVDTVLAVQNEGRLLNIPIRVNKEKLAVLADSVNQKLKRFWQKSETWFNNININLRNIDDSLYRSFQLSLVPFVGTNHKMSGHVANDYSLNILGGYSLGVRKAEFGGVFNLVRGDVQSAQFAGVFNGVGGRVKGVQFAGIFNGVAGEVEGAQFAGVFNANAGEIRGPQIAGVLNMNADNSSGVSFAGVANISAGARSSPQIAGVLNIASGDTKGFQFGGVFNVAFREIKGVQVAGVFNVAGGEVRGSQIAGVFNVARKVNGFQIGLINIADSVQGIPIGFLSFVGKGYHKIEISADEIFYNNIAFRTGTQYFHNIFNVGAKPSSYNEDETVWTFGYGVGSGARLSRKLFLDLDLTSNQIVAGNSIEALNLLNKVYVGVDFQVLKKISISAGATVNGLITETEYDAYPELFTGYQPNVFLDRDVGNEHNLKMWLGAKLGVRFL